MSETAPKNYTGKHREMKVSRSGRAYNDHVTRAEDMYLVTPVSPELLVSHRDYRELMTHDGSSTYLVHSATPDQAEKIMQEGLQVAGSPDRTNLESTVVMLSGPEDKQQVAKNAYNLGYLYDGGFTEVGRRTAKVIFEIPKPTPPIKIGRTAFTGTHLGVADGVNILQVGESGRQTLYKIPAARAMGYIDLGGANLPWVVNPNFEPSTSADVTHDIGSVALNS